MVECLRRWSRHYRVTVYGWEGTRQLFEHQQVSGIEHVLWSSTRFQSLGRPILFAAQTLVGRARAHDLQLTTEALNLLVSSSDFLPDSYPAEVLKRRYPHVFWVAAFYLFAPPFSEWLTGQPGPGFAFTAYRPAQQWTLRRILRWADLILTTGEEDRERMVKLGRKPESVFAVRGGVDFNVLASVPEPTTKQYDAVFIGRLHPQKGVRELLKIWQHVVATKPGSRLAIIGAGPLETELKAQCRALRMETAIDFLGFMDGPEKFRIIKSSRVVVHPAIYDSGGMAPSEALACALPGVAFDISALRTYYPRGFLKATPGDRLGFADCLARLLTDPVLYDRMSEEARAEGKRWDWDLRSEELMQAIQERLRTKP